MNMNIDTFTLIGVVMLCATTIEGFLRTKEKMSLSIKILKWIIFILGFTMILYADNGQQERINKLNEIKKQNTALTGKIDSLMQTSVEYVPEMTKSKFDKKSGKYITQYFFRTNPALNARDVRIEMHFGNVPGRITAKGLIYADRPGVHLESSIALKLLNEPNAIRGEVDFLAADETIQISIQSEGNIMNPEFIIKSWTRKPFYIF